MKGLCNLSVITSEVFATGLPLEVYRQYHKTAHYVGTKKLNKLDDSKKLAVLKKVNRDRKKLMMKKVWKQVRDGAQDYKSQRWSSRIIKE